MAEFSPCMSRWTACTFQPHRLGERAPVGWRMTDACRSRWRARLEGPAERRRSTNGASASRKAPAIASSAIRWTAAAGRTARPADLRDPQIEHGCARLAPPGAATTTLVAAGASSQGDVARRLLVTSPPGWLKPKPTTTRQRFQQSASGASASPRAFFEGHELGYQEHRFVDAVHLDPVRAAQGGLALCPFTVYQDHVPAGGGRRPDDRPRSRLPSAPRSLTVHRSSAAGSSSRWRTGTLNRPGVNVPDSANSSQLYHEREHQRRELRRLLAPQQAMDNLARRSIVIGAHRGGSTRRPCSAAAARGWTPRSATNGSASDQPQGRLRRRTAPQQ